MPALQAHRILDRQPDRHRRSASALWGYFLYQGVVDPLGGINTLWPLFGIANQMLAGIALMLCTVVLFKMKRERYAWVTIAAGGVAAGLHDHRGLQKIFDANPAIGFLAQANKYRDALANGRVLAPAKEHRRRCSTIMFNSLHQRGADRAVPVRGAERAGLCDQGDRARRAPIRTRSDRETPYVAVTPAQQAGEPLMGTALVPARSVRRRIARCGGGWCRPRGLCCGVPDYDNYVRHMLEKHPEREVMDYKTFFRERQEAGSAEETDSAAADALSDEPIV